MKESQIELTIRKLAMLMGWVCYKGFGVNGAPDIILVKQGIVFMIEVKTKTGRLSTNQKRHANILEKNGTPYYVVKGIDDDLIKSIFKEQEERVSKSC